MDDMNYFNKGEKVTYTDDQGGIHEGTVESYRRGWVMVELDTPHETEQGWSASKMMVRASDLGLG
jgi:hypothetical protein